MGLRFHKYQGTGNDFIIFDNRQNQLSLTQQEVSFLCHRRFGIGADGLMLLSQHGDYDFEMIYFNADGRQSSMCGNGGRCLVKFAHDVGLVKERYHFLAIDGLHEAFINQDGTVALKMNEVSEITPHHNNQVLNTGSPHYITKVQRLDDLDVFEKGRQVRYSEDFKAQGINVNFVECTSSPQKIRVRTYERGVEDETFSCGTGVTAAALVFAHNPQGFNRVEVETKGGTLRVEFEKQGNQFTNIYLVGPAEKVFEGTVVVPSTINESKA